MYQEYLELCQRLNDRFPGHKSEWKPLTAKEFYKKINDIRIPFIEVVFNKKIDSAE